MHCLATVSYTHLDVYKRQLLGRNGVGKTTFFNCLNGDIKSDSGHVSLLTDHKQRDIKADDIGYVLSTPTVPPFLTGREFLKFFLDIHESTISNPKSPERCV